MTGRDTPAPAWCLVGLNGELAAARFGLQAGMTLGRAANCDVFLPDPRLRRRQAWIDQTAEGLTFVNAGAPHEIEINGVDVRRHVLRDGDTLRLGRFLLRAEAIPHHEAGGSLAAGLQDDPTAAAASVSSLSALVLAVRFTYDGDPRLFADRLEHLSQRATQLADRTGTFAATQESTAWQWAWTHDTSGLPPWGLAFQVYEALVQECYLTDGPAGSLHVRAGAGVGRLHGDRRLDTRRTLWGPACESALRALFSHSSEGFRLDDDATPDVGVDPRDPRRLLTLRLPTTGRRHKFALAEPAILYLGWQRKSALLVRAVFDPEASLAGLSFLVRDPLEVGDTCRWLTPEGQVVPVVCRKCQPFADRRATSVLATVTCSAEDFHQWFGVTRSTRPPAIIAASTPGAA